MSAAAGPDLIQNGLVFHIDTADRRCYPGSGNSCFDLTRINGTGSMVNITFTSDKGFRFVSNSKMTFNRNFINNSDNLTAFIILNTVFTTSLSSIFGSMDPISYNGWIASYSLGLFIADYGNDGNGESVSANLIGLDKQMCAFKISPSISKAFVNGNFGVGPASLNWGTQSQSTIEFGDVAELGWPPVGHTIYKAMIYNRSLTDVEMLQNFNALKGTFRRR